MILVKEFYSKIILIGMIVINLVIFSRGDIIAQCYTTLGNHIHFTMYGGSTGSEYQTIFVLTDYNGFIIYQTTTDSFPGVNVPGLYKIFGINYDLSKGITGISVGANINAITGTCFNISAPFEILICPDDNDSCNTFDGSFSFTTTGGNPLLETKYILTDLNKNILQISVLPSFTGLNEGVFLIYPINFDQLTGLDISNNVTDLQGNCVDIGKPIFVKSCASCFISLGEDIELCSPFPLMLTSIGSSSGTYLWNTGQTSSAIQINPISSTAYSVTFTNAQGCSASDVLNVSILGVPNAYAGEDQSIICGQKVMLTAQMVENATYLWSTGETSPTIVVSPKSTTNYSVRVNVAYCSDYDITTVFVNEIFASISGNNVIKEGDCTQLIADGGSTYLWSNGAITSTISVSPTITTTYTVTVTNGGGCSDIANITVNVTACEKDCTHCGDMITFNATPTNNLLSTVFVLADINGQILKIGTQHSFGNLSPNTYLIYGVNYDPSKPFSGLSVGNNISQVSGECLDISDVYVSKLCAKPIVSISGDKMICHGDTTELSVCGGSTYIWSNGQNSANIKVNPDVTTTYIVTVTYGSSCVTIDSIVVTVNNCGKIGDFVWEDMNGNGIQDIGEPGIPEVKVILLKNGTQYRSTFTDPFGRYLFDSIPSATYVLLFYPPTGYFRTTENLGNDREVDSDANTNSGLTLPITLSSDKTNFSVDAGFYKKAKLGNYVWEDVNRNGRQDVGEVGLENVKVSVTGVTGFGLAVDINTITNPNGFYIFNDLNPGAYTVIFSKPDGFKSSPVNNINDPTLDSDASILDGRTNSILITSGDSNVYIDAGFYKFANIGDFVWFDQGDISDIQDSNDVGLDNIVVQLFSNTNHITPVLTTTTFTYNEKAGFYNFEVDQPGQYFIKVQKPVQYDFVIPNAGNGSNDSKITAFEDGISSVFNLTYGASLSNMDIGLQFKPLPITLLEFAGYWDKTKNVNIIQWVTLSEINNDYFELERSFGGLPFMSIEKVVGNGNSSIKNTYLANDVNITQNGNYIYRLKQVDFDGRASYSDLINVFVNRQDDIKSFLYPNPTIVHALLEIHTKKGAKVKVDIFDEHGRIFQKEVINNISEDGYLFKELNAEFMPRGVYQIRIDVDNNLHTLKWIIIN